MNLDRVFQHQALVSGTTVEMVAELQVSLCEELDNSSHLHEGIELILVAAFGLAHNQSHGSTFQWQSKKFVLPQLYRSITRKAIDSRQIVDGSIETSAIFYE